MNAQDMIAKTVQFLDKEKEVFITIYTRDENGCVTQVKRYPLENAFSHCDDVTLICEESRAVLTNDEAGLTT